MDPQKLAIYYVTNKNEFYGEDGHEKLLVGLKKYVRPINDTSKIVGIDVGSCVGDYIHHINHICNETNKKILCFEPNPVNIKELEPKINSDANLKLFKCCVSNETSRTSFYNWKDSTSNDKGNAIAGLRSGGEKISSRFLVLRISYLIYFYHLHFDTSFGLLSVRGGEKIKEFLNSNGQNKLFQPKESLATTPIPNKFRYLQ